MKFSCTQENLNQGLAIVSHIASKNVNLPILGNVLIKGDDKVLRFMTTNLEIAIRCVVRGKIEDQGEFTVPSKLFSDYVSLLPKDRVDVTMEGNALTVACGSYQTKLNGMPASEFPLIPTIESQQKFVVKVGDLRKAVGQVLFAVAPNESRPEISGVLFKFNPSEAGIELILAATDSYRLAERAIKVNATGSTAIKDPMNVIVPSRTVAELIRILGVFKESLESPEEMEIHIGENQILFSYDTVELISRTIEGKYPDYRQLIPERFETEVVVTKDELARAVKTASLFSRTGLNDIHFTFSPESSIKLASTNSQTGEHAVDLDGAIQGKQNAITVNFRYFLDGVNNVESDHVILQLIDGMSPCLVRGYDGAQPIKEYLYIVMPIRQ
ncbi:MAG TPA: DNA polymerase III subunit beta [Patescibacteria group bacterium]|nr:DNA polymerase III subunit beta [Patescibacteria group bacterium]